MNDVPNDHEIYLQEMAISNVVNAREIFQKRSNLKGYIDRVKEPNQIVCRIATMRIEEANWTEPKGLRSLLYPLIPCSQRTAEN